MGVVFFTSVFWAWVRMAWKGLDLKSELAMIMGCRILSSFLTFLVSAILGFKAGPYNAFFRWFWESGVPFPSPINPGFGFFAGGLEGSGFEDSARVVPPGVPLSDSIAAIADWMSDSAPPASSSLAFSFSRRACDLEYGKRDASTSSG